ncbi:hypothetical protein CMI37_34060 [Candidatus Pacearchaeota archaeon]|nr:hypothetical protein [Candidatus Pacearchaeota archaeon]|tara:strand:+ start:1340 stop:2431 length:1092 start_codon:yes stop_codon:yes gene_type:complete
MKKLFLAGLLFLVLISFASAEVDLVETDVYYFGRVGCLHCANVDDSGVLERVAVLEGVSLQKYDVVESQEGRDLFNNFASDFGISSYERGVPFVVVDCGGDGVGNFYFMGDNPIIDELENKLETCSDGGSGVGGQGGVSSASADAKKITLWGLVVAALIDSINPCAFGVLIFLMLSLLKIGSSKRALKAGLVYTFVVFVVYFLSGFGIFKVLQSFTSISRFVYMGAGVLVLVVGGLQFYDVIFKKRTIGIPKKAGPIIEKIIHRGTIPAMILLGIVVSLFELPCTGGIYLGILTMMSINKTFAVSYLLIYNLIFVLPLIIITLLIYKGASPEKLQRWTVKERKWMKVAAGVVLVALGVYILVF